MKDKSKYGCWSNKYKEFTIKVKVPQLESYSKVVGEMKARSDEEEEAGFDVHADEESACAKMLSSSTETELIKIDYFLRFSAYYESQGFSKLTRDIPITLVSNPAHAQTSAFRYTEKPRGWLPLTSPEQIIKLPEDFNSNDKLFKMKTVSLNNSYIAGKEEKKVNTHVAGGKIVNHHKNAKVAPLPEDDEKKINECADRYDNVTKNEPEQPKIDNSGYETNIDGVRDSREWL